MSTEEQRALEAQWLALAAEEERRKEQSLEEENATRFLEQISAKKDNQSDDN